MLHWDRIISQTERPHDTEIKTRTSIILHAEYKSRTQGTILLHGQHNAKIPRSTRLQQNPNTSLTPPDSPPPDHSSSPPPSGSPLSPVYTWCLRDCIILFPREDTLTESYCGCGTEEALMQYFIDNGWRVATENSNNVETDTIPDQNSEEINQEAVATFCSDCRD